MERKDSSTNEIVPDVSNLLELPLGTRREISFLALPHKALNRDKRCLSATRFLDKDEREERLRTYSAWSASRNFGKDLDGGMKGLNRSANMEDANDQTTDAHTSSRTSGAFGSQSVCSLTHYHEQLMRARALNREIWEKNVINREEQLSNRASSVSLRADQELHETSSYLDQPHHDAVNEAKEVIDNINKTCQKKLTELNLEEQARKAAEDRWNEVQMRRKMLSDRQTRSLAFGHIKNTRDCKKPSMSKTSSRWVTNPIVKKPLRMASVELTSNKKARMQQQPNVIPKPQPKPQVTAKKELSAREKKMLDAKEALRKRQLILNAVLNDY